MRFAVFAQATPPPINDVLSVPREPSGGPGTRETDEILTQADVASRLHKSVRCLEVWLRRGYLPYFKVGRSVLFRWPDVVAALSRFRIG